MTFDEPVGFLIKYLALLSGLYLAGLALRRHSRTGFGFLKSVHAGLMDYAAHARTMRQTLSYLRCDPWTAAIPMILYAPGILFQYLIYRGWLSQNISWGLVAIRDGDLASMNRLDVIYYFEDAIRHAFFASAFSTQLFLSLFLTTAIFVPAGLFGSRWLRHLVRLWEIDQRSGNEIFLARWMTYSMITVTVAMTIFILIDLFDGFDQLGRGGFASFLCVLSMVLMVPAEFALGAVWRVGFGGRLITRLQKRLWTIRSLGDDILRGFPTMLAVMSIVYGVPILFGTVVPMIWGAMHLDFPAVRNILSDFNEWLSPIFALTAIASTPCLYLLLTERTNLKDTIRLCSRIYQRMPDRIIGHLGAYILVVMTASLTISFLRLPLDLNGWFWTTFWLGHLWKLLLIFASVVGTVGLYIRLEESRSQWRDLVDNQIDADPARSPVPGQ